MYQDKKEQVQNHQKKTTFQVLFLFYKLILLSLLYSFFISRLLVSSNSFFLGSKSCFSWNCAVLSFTLSTNPLKTFLKAFKPSVRSLRNSLVLSYIKITSRFKSLILYFKDLFSSSNSLSSFTFSLNRSTRPLYFSLTCPCSLLNFLYSLAISVLMRFLTCCFNLSLSLAAVTKFL